MKIVVLDGYTLNPGDLDWQGLQALGECIVYDRTTPEETAGRIGDAEIVLTNKVKLDRAVIEAAPRLRYIGVTATGYNIIDLAAASGRGIVVTNVPAYSTAFTAQTAIALLLELTNHAGLHSRSVHEGQWSRCADFCYWQAPLRELDGLTLGIVGWGRIGMAVARTAQALGMKIAVTSRSQTSAPEPEIRFLPLPQLMAESDVLSLHCALTDETKGMINARTLATMKPSALLINTARGGLIVEEDLVEALRSGRIAGAGLDVLTAEPPVNGSPLLGAPNCVITPHIGWASASARRRLLAQVAANLEAYLAGKPSNQVNAK